MSTPGVQTIHGTDVLAAGLAAATERKTFKALDYIRNGGVVMPEGKIRLFTNVAACHRAQEITNQLADLDSEYAGSIAGGAPEEVIAPLLAERAKLAEINEKSTITFYLRGVHPAVDNILKKKLNVNSKKRRKAGEDDDEAWEAYVGEFLAKAVQYTELGDGSIDEHTFTTEEMLELYNSLPETESKRLWVKADELSHVMGLASIVVDAGFPGGDNVDPGTAESGSEAVRVNGSNVG